MSITPKGLVVPPLTCAFQGKRGEKDGNDEKDLKGREVLGGATCREYRLSHCSMHFIR